MPSSAFGSDKWRTRPLVIVARPENTGSSSGPSTAARELGAARSAHVAEESLQDAEVRVARRLQRDRSIAQADAAADAEAACRRRPAAGPAMFTSRLSSEIRIGAAFFSA